jgi:hypothetical protein
VLTVDHRFALSNLDLVSAPFKIVLQRQLSDPGMERLHIDRRALRLPIQQPRLRWPLAAMQAVIWLG